MNERGIASILGKGKNNFILDMVQTFFRANSDSCERDVKRPRAESYHLTSSSTGVKNAWMYTSIFSYIFIAPCVINYRKKRPKPTFASFISRATKKDPRTAPLVGVFVVVIIIVIIFATSSAQPPLSAINFIYKSPGCGE